MKPKRKFWSRKFIFFTFFYWFLVACGMACAWLLGNNEPECGIGWSVIGGAFAGLLYGFIYSEYRSAVRWSNL